MRTLALLAALSLLAFQAQADLLPETAGEAPDQEQPGEEDQEVAVSFGGAEGLALQNTGRPNHVLCTCRLRHCFRREREVRRCRIGNAVGLFCCR